MMLDIASCGMCGKAVVIEKGMRPICDGCRGDEQRLYDRVRTLLRDNPHTEFTAADVAKRLDVEEKKINFLVESGLLEIVHKYALADTQKFRKYI
jgi:hypothetical protein